MASVTVSFQATSHLNTFFRSARPRTSYPRICMASCRAASTGQPDYYKMLSLNEPHKAGREEIKRAYRAMALRCHPDVCPPNRKEEATRLLAQLNHAYEVLSNPALREEYDAQLGLLQCPTNFAAAQMSSDYFVGREVWEWQLRELQRRSIMRAATKKPRMAPGTRGVC